MLALILAWSFQRNVDIDVGTDADTDVDMDVQFLQLRLSIFSLPKLAEIFSGPKLEKDFLDMDVDIR